MPKLEILTPPPIVGVPEQLPGPVQQTDGSWNLPPQLAEELELRLIDYRRYPEKCQALLRQQAEIGESRVEAAVKVATSRCATDHVRQQAERVEQTGMPVWHVALIAAGAGATGVLVGIVVGLVGAN